MYRATILVQGSGGTPGRVVRLDATPVVFFSATMFERVSQTCDLDVIDASDVGHILQCGYISAPKTQQPPQKEREKKKKDPPAGAQGSSRVPLM